MTQSQALVPGWIEKTKSKMILNILAIVAGSVLLAGLAQVSIPLPWTPVPITGQTFGVALLALCWGSQRAFGSFALYLAEGAIGLPVFALGKSGLLLGPTFGYLAGMWLASFVVGFLADQGYAKKFKTAFLCCCIGSAITFLCGLLGLSFFAPSDGLLVAGLWPFLPGDIIKNTLAAGVAVSLSKTLK